MAKAKTGSRQRMGRPKKDVQLNERVLVRLDAATKNALDGYAQRSGSGGAATAIRMIVTEKLRGEGLLK